MAYRDTYDRQGGGGFGGLEPGVRGLLIATGLVFLAQMLFRNASPGLERLLGLVPADVFARGHLWQPITYIFLHGGVLHLLFNMLALFMFGSELERTWGTKEFLRYYLVCGVGAGLVHWLVSMSSPIPVIGASGSVFGLLLAFGLLFPDRIILLWGIAPVKAKYFVLGYGLLELFAATTGPQGGVARFAHLGGLATGFLYLKSETLLWPVKRRFGRFRKGLAARAGAAESERRERRQAEIDRILEKIQAEGMGALTEAEKKTLSDAAKRGRGSER
jgi:membrane associated rhomboid family serine protease